MAEPLHPVGELAVAPAAASIDIGGLVGAAGIQIPRQDIGGEIVVARNRVDGGLRIEAGRRRSGNKWFSDNGWTYPVLGPASTGLGAVQQFFEALGLVQPPKVEIRETEMRFAGKVGERRSIGLLVPLCFRSSC